MPAVRLTPAAPACPPPTAEACGAAQPQPAVCQGLVKLNPTPPRSARRPWQEGGVGFDYRLNMAIADKWIEVGSRTLRKGRGVCVAAAQAVAAAGLLSKQEGWRCSLCICYCCRLRLPPRRVRASRAPVAATRACINSSAYPGPLFPCLCCAGADGAGRLELEHGQHCAHHDQPALRRGLRGERQRGAGVAQMCAGLWLQGSPNSWQTGATPRRAWCVQLCGAGGGGR